MTLAHVIEVGDITAGIVVQDQGCFRFFASERACHPLEGARFRTIDHATRAARDSLRGDGRRRAVSDRRSMRRAPGEGRPSWSS
jgi:hypothetical protein